MIWQKDVANHFESLYIQIGKKMWQIVWNSDVQLYTIIDVKQNKNKHKDTIIANIYKTSIKNSQKIARF